MTLARALVVAVLFCPFQDDEKITLRIATQCPQGTIWANGLAEMAKEVREKTKVKFRVFPGGILGDEALAATKIGQHLLGGALFSGPGMAALLPEVRLVEVPFLCETDREIDGVRKEVEPDVTKHFAEKGLVFLGWTEFGWLHIFCKEKVKSLEELRKLKIWRPEGDALAEELFKELGLTGSTVPLPDVLSAIESGTIDAACVTPVCAQGYQWHTKLKHLLRLPMGCVTGALLLDKTEWEKISEAARGTIAEIARRHLDKTVADARKLNTNVIPELEKEGVAVSVATDADIDECRKRGAAVAETMSADGKLYSRELLARARKAVEKVRQEKK